MARIESGSRKPARKLVLKKEAIQDLAVAGKERRIKGGRLKTDRLATDCCPPVSGPAIKS